MTAIRLFCPSQLAGAFFFSGPVLRVPKRCLWRLRCTLGSLHQTLRTTFSRGAPSALSLFFGELWFTPGAAPRRAFAAPP